jgi:hypothetical protein
MNPKRKLRLILLVGMVPFASLLLYVVRSHHLPKWFPFVEFGYFVAFLIYMTLHVRRHPELRSYPTKKAIGVNADSVAARMWTSIFLMAGIAAAMFILLQRDPLARGWGRSVTPNPALISGVHGVAWVGLVPCVAGFVRMVQVWYRTMRAASSGSSARS